MKNISLLIFIIITFNVKAQVGINTNQPVSGLLHIDSKGNNGTNTTNENEDDIFISSSGQVGVGTTEPNKLLHIKTTKDTPKSIIIQDGTQSKNKYLRSDDNGNASWTNAGEIDTSQGVLSATGVNVIASSIPNSNTFVYTNAYIDLMPGMWLVTASFILKITNVPVSNTTTMWMRTTFSDKSTYDTNSPDIYGTMRYISGVAYTNCQTTLNGFIVINNKTASTKRYYYQIGWFSSDASTTKVAQIANFASGSSEENYLLAFKMKNN